MRFDKLHNMLQHLDEEGKDFFQFGLSSFFSDILAYDFVALGGPPLDIEDIQEKLGQKIFEHLYICGVEFFLSNEYPSQSGSWNAVDHLFKKRGKLLPPVDQLYLKGLRDSYMSIYEIIDVQLGKSITVRNLIEENSPPITIKEQKATHSLCRWDLIGARIVRTPKENLLAAGALLLNRDAFKEAKANIDKITKAMIEPRYLEAYKQVTKDPILLVKKMWAKEIAENWLEDHMQHDEEPDFFNYDGDKLDFYTLQFPLTTSVGKIVENINNLPELIPYEVEGVKYAWFWPRERDRKPARFKQGQGASGYGNERFVDSQVVSPDGEAHRIFAEIKIKGKKLLVDVNSRQRANILEDYIQTHLSNYVENPIHIQHKWEEAVGKGEHSSKKPSSGISKKEEQKLLSKFLDQHYKEWLDTPLPILNQKTPREAVRTSNGMQEIINLLKDMEKHNTRLAREEKCKSYNFDWLYKELGVSKESLS